MELGDALFQTSDQYLAAFLFQQRLPYVGTQTDGNRVAFQFEHRSLCEAYVKQYETNVSVKIQDFCTALRKIYGEIRTHKQREGKP